MKRVLIFALALVILFSLCACGTKKDAIVTKQLCDGFWHHQEAYPSSVDVKGTNMSYTLYLTDIYRFSEDNTYIYSCYSYTTLFNRTEKLSEKTGTYSIKGNKIILSDGGMEDETEIFFIIDDITEKISFHVTDSSGQTTWKQYRVEGDYSEDFIIKYFTVP